MYWQGLIITGCMSSPTRAAHQNTIASGGFFFSKIANLEQEAASKFLNEAVKQGLGAIEPTIPEKNKLATGLRRGSVTTILLHPQLQHDFLPG